MRGTRYLYIFLVCLLCLQIVSANLGSFKQEQCVNIRVLANCSNINLIEITGGNNVYVINDSMTLLGGQTFNYSFCNTSNIGHYTYSWNNPCTDCSLGDCGNDFYVTPTGEDSTQANSIIFISILVFLLLIFSITIYGAYKMPWKNNRDEDGFIISLNDLKYLKIVLWIVVYLELLFITMIAKNVTYGYAVFDGAYQFFNIAFWFFLIGLLPMFPLLVFFTLIIWLTDKKTQQMLERGIRVE